MKLGITYYFAFNIKWNEIETKKMNKVKSEKNSNLLWLLQCPRIQDRYNTYLCFPAFCTDNNANVNAPLGMKKNWK
jgi:hypothetical protein